MSTDDENLLLALAKYAQPFDAAVIHGWVWRDEPLWQALSFLRVRQKKPTNASGRVD